MVRRLRIHAATAGRPRHGAVEDIASYATSPAFTDDERAAIAYAEAMTTDPHSVTDEQVADLRLRFGDAGVIELTYQIGLEHAGADERHAGHHRAGLQFR